MVKSEEENNNLVAEASRTLGSPYLDRNFENINQVKGRNCGGNWITKCFFVVLHNNKINSTLSFGKMGLNICYIYIPGGGFLKRISDTKIYIRSFQNTCVNHLQLLYI